MRPIANCAAAPAAAPVRPPIPTTLPTADGGNKSEASVKMFAENPWCAAPARPTRATTSHKFFVNGAYSTGNTHMAQISIAVFRPAFAAAAAPDHCREKPPPRHASHAANCINHHDGSARFPQRQMKCPLEIPGQPKGPKPPDRVREHLSDRECPGLFLVDQPRPRDGADSLRRVGLNVP